VELRVDDELVLRPPTPEDVPAIAAACADEEIVRFLPLVPSPYTEADAAGFVAHVRGQWERGDPERTWAIDREGTLLGMVSLRLRDGGTVGYWLAPHARGAGVMTRVVRAVLDYAQREGVERLRLFAHPDNRASQRVAEKAGFRHAGRAPHDPPFRDGTLEAELFELP
jgi:RimJ/RimL family protein N-acetyltransferase